MKRVCNEQERQLLFENRECLLTGILKTGTRNGVVPILVGVFAGLIIAIAGCAFFVELGLPEWLVWVWFGFSFIVPPKLIAGLWGVARTKRSAKAFLKKERLMVNGATIVAIDAEEKRFVYIEDDLTDENGKPIILDYPALPPELLKGTVNRLLVMYENESSFQLMAVNDALKNMISAESGVDFGNMDLSECKHLPHPNALGLAYEERTLSEGEKEKFSDLYVQYNRKDTAKMLKIVSVIMFVVIMLLCILLGVTESSLKTTLPIGLTVFAGVLLLFVFSYYFGKKNIRRQASFETVKEVVFHSYIMSQTGQTVISVGNVYEWMVNEFEVTPYQNANMSPKTTYGTVLYKLTNHKGKVFFLPKE